MVSKRLHWHHSKMILSHRQSRLAILPPLLICISEAFFWSVPTRPIHPLLKTSSVESHSEQHQVKNPSRQRWTVLSSSSDSGFDDLRKSLEESWNEQDMGIVPSSPEAAAHIAARCVLEAKKDGKNLCIVDMLLPRYDIAGGSIYDEILASEFCMGLADCLESNSVIYVKNQKMLDAVRKVLEEQNGWQPESSYEDEWEEIEEEVEIEGTSETGDAGDVDDFRKQLTASWDDSPTTPEDAPSPEAPPSEPNTTKRLVKRRVMKQLPPKSIVQRNFRLVSLFGDETISPGPDMGEDIVNAIRKHGKPTDEDDTLIVLGANSLEEAYAVRALSHSFGESKSIILVNCKIDMLPPEWMKGVMAYSILPLKAKRNSLDTDIGANKKGQMERLPTEPKVCVLRRYPEDWQIYVDATGDGFKLAGTVTPDTFGIKGPDLEFVGKKLEQYLSDFYWNLP